MSRRFSTLAALCAVLGLVACGSSAQEESAGGDGTTEDGSGNELNETDLKQAVESDPVLKALRAAATADIEKYDISVKDIAVPQRDAYTGISLASGYRTSGLDWFKSPKASYPDNKRWDQGSEIGKKCQWASIFRFEAIFKTPPAEAEEMKRASTWSGNFWSWTDDYAAGNQSIQNPTPVYAWSSGLWKWIGSSGKGDVCRLPTRAMVIGLMKACKQHAEANNRDAKGCRMPSFEASQQYVQQPAGGEACGGPPPNARCAACPSGKYKQINGQPSCECCTSATPSP